MSSLTLMAAAAPTRLDPIRLFLDADIVVQLVMAGLLLASVWVWMIIVSFSLRMAKLRSRTIEYENEFWQADSFDRFTSERGAKDVPAARVAQAAVGEYRRSTKGAVRDPEALRGRIATAMDSQIALEADDIAERLNFLATVGSVAPFVGLFGTVWGIMNSFFQIGAQESSSLAVVAPGISEALFRHRDRPVRGYSRSNRLQPLQPSGRSVRSALAAFRRQAERHLQPATGNALMAMGLASTRGGGRRGRGSRRQPMSEINVTPFVDVMLVLLIIFMVTAPLLTAGVPIDLPDSRAAQLPSDRQQVTISIDEAGYVYIDDAAVELGGLPQALESIPRSGEGPDITLRADRALDYGRVMAVMGELNRAGLNRISLITNSAAPASVNTGSSGEE